MTMKKRLRNEQCIKTGRNIRLEETLYFFQSVLHSIFFSYIIYIIVIYFFQLTKGNKIKQQQ